MKYLKKFENKELTIRLKHCFDFDEDIWNLVSTDESNKYKFNSIDGSAKIVGINKKPIYLGKYQSQYFELTDDIIDDLLSGIGKCGELGYKFDKLMFNSGSGARHFRNIEELESIDKLKDIHFYENVNQITIYFRSSK